MRGEGDGDADWEGGDNRSLTVPASGAASVVINWGRDMSVELSEEPLPVMTVGSLDDWDRAGYGANYGSGSDSDFDVDVPVLSSSSSSWDDSMLRPQWEGREIRFMRSNEHTRCAGVRGVAARGMLAPNLSSLARVVTTSCCPRYQHSPLRVLAGVQGSAWPVGHLWAAGARAAAGGGGP